MRRILLHQDGGTSFVWDVSDPVLIDGAFLALFKLFDFGGAYDRSDLDSIELQLVSQARHGNTKAARALLLLRNGQGRECFELVDLQENPAEQDRDRPVRLVQSPPDEVKVDGF